MAAGRPARVLSVAAATGRPGRSSRTTSATGGCRTAALSWPRDGPAVSGAVATLDDWRDMRVPLSTVAAATAAVFVLASCGSGDGGGDQAASGDRSGEGTGDSCTIEGE